MKDVRGLDGNYVKLNVDTYAGRKVLVLDTYNNGASEVELGANEIDDLIKNLEKAKEELGR